MNVDNNRKEVARLFKERTGVKYQNWIQALSVSSRPKRLALALIPKWIAFVILFSALIYFVSCTPHTKITIQDSKRFRHAYLERIPLTQSKPIIRYCGKHHRWEKVKVVWTRNGYVYYVHKPRGKRWR